MSLDEQITTAADTRDSTLAYLNATEKVMNTYLGKAGNLDEATGLKTILDTAFQTCINACKEHCNLVPVTRTYIETRMDGDKVYASVVSRQRKFEQLFKTYKAKEEKRNPSLSHSGDYRSSKTNPKAESTVPVPETPSTSANSGYKHPHFKIPKLKIDTFSGDALSWPRFITNFNDIVLEYAKDPKTRLKYLISNCEGRAKQAIVNKTMINDPQLGYDEAISVLEKRFGSEKLILAAVRKELRKGVHLSGTYESLHDYAIKLENLSGILHWLGKAHELDTYDTTQIIFKKLPHRLQEHYLWREQASGENEMLFETLLEFIHNAADVANTPGRNAFDKHDVTPYGKNSTSHTSFITADNTHPQSSGKTENYSCGYCQQPGHSIYKCTKFINSINTQQRRDFVKQERRCYACLKKYHNIDGIKKAAIVAECPSKGTCKTCHKKGHHTLLHYEQSQTNVNSGNVVNVVKTTQEIACNINASDNFVRLPVIPVKVSLPGQRYNNEQTVLCFLDQGSSVNFISDKIMEKLNPTVKSAGAKLISGIQNILKWKQGYEFSIDICGLNSDHVINIGTVFSLDKLPSPGGSFINPMTIAKNYDHLKNINFPQIECNEIHLLIGANEQLVHRQLEERYAKPGLPRGIRGHLGWYLAGSIDNEVRDVATHTVNCIEVISEQSCNTQLHQLFDYEFRDEVYSNKVSLSDEDKLSITKFDETVTKVGNRYQVGVLFREDNPVMPNNRFIAEKRLLKMKQKFISNPDILNNFTAKMKKHEAENQISPICRPTDAIPGTINYLDYFSVASDEKFRIVFNCSQKFRGRSLNDMIMSGPNNLNDLTGTLIRFREGPLAFCCDIKAMFHQVLLNPEVRDFFRFLWYKDGDISAQPTEYRFNVLVFGAADSPYKANRVLHLCADENRDLVSASSIKVIKENTYMDDIFKAAHTTTELVECNEGIKTILASGSFHATKYLSNDAAFLKTIDPSDIAQSKLNVDFSDENLVMHKTLGLMWDNLNDVWECKVNIPLHIPNTKRSILRASATLFDPFGFIAPATLLIKKLIQTLCAVGCNWDDSIPSEYENVSKKCFLQLPAISSVKIPRCTHPYINLVESSLHIFTDASNIGLSACVYQRNVYENGAICLSLLEGKSRVTPRKKITIPKLELCAAKIGVKIGRFVQSQTSLPITKSYYWTDSLAVLFILANRKKRFNIFVANRRSMILEQTTLSQWHFIGTKENPADIGSRGCYPNETEKLQRWHRGAEFLHLPENEWKTQPEINAESNKEAEKEFLPDKLFCCSSITSDSTNDIHDSTIALINKYSDIYKLQFTVARLIRFSRFLQFKCGKSNINPNENSSITVNELDTANKRIIKVIQRQMFPKLVETLNDHPDFDSALKCKQRVAILSSHLRCLNPIKVNGILHVGSHLRNAPIPDETKFPIILPRNHHFTKLIILKHHYETAHHGAQYVLGRIREKYWIVRGLSTVKSVLLNCWSCRKIKGKCLQQQLGPLPAARVTARRHCWYSTGTDVMGPILVKRGRAREKRYICSFTCLSSRCVHFEVMHSIDTDSFLKAISRFISNRSVCPKEIFSDNGGNYIGAEKVLRDLISTWNKDHIHKTLAKKGIDWHFSPPKTPHFGGVWERIFRSVKSSFRFMIGDTILNDEDLATVVAEVCQILNNRPLVPLTANSDDVAFLTPNMLLGGHIDAALPPGQFIGCKGYTKSYRLVQSLADIFWSKWLKYYLPLLAERQRWQKPTRNLVVGDTVLVADDNLKRNQWFTGRVFKILSDRDGVVRQCWIHTAKGDYRRNITKLVLLEAAEESENDDSSK